MYRVSNAESLESGPGRRPVRHGMAVGHRYSVGRVFVSFTALSPEPRAVLTTHQIRTYLQH